MTSHENRTKIIGGPDNMALMMSLFDDVMSGDRRTVRFQVPSDEMKRKQFVEVVLNSLEREDGSGRSWIFSGRITERGSRINGYYDVRPRTGWFESVDNEA